ncbi:PolC-type DNA polymerase III [Atopobacter phocae]|uniref:PolC-type DNA polymerase III n=1 Tax=Atopobacter phocae TaxID=136492 RepID=UPI00047143DC|nr:PolC-type DNA polymerase III [Atopobacter phocae]
MEGIELFTHLADQINLSQHLRQEWFNNASVNRVIVYEEEGTWEFRIGLHTFIPSSVYMEFIDAMKQSFPMVAQIEVQIEYGNDQVIDEALIHDYWPLVVRYSELESPFLRHILAKHVPAYVDGQLMIKCGSLVEQEQISKRYVDQIRSIFNRMGFPRFSIMSETSDEKNEASERAFKEHQDKLEKERIERAQQVIQEQKEQPVKKAKKSNGTKNMTHLVIGREVPDNQVMQMSGIEEELPNVVVQGYIFDTEIRTFKTGRKLLSFKMTDYTSSVAVKMFQGRESDAELFDLVKKGMWVRVFGKVQFDTFDNDLVLMAQAVSEFNHPKRMDTYEGDKRIEFHLHSNMSQMDATNSISDYVKQAAEWGHPAIAITDHGNLQAYPEAHAASQKHQIKMIYGVEANIVDDGVPIAFNEREQNLDEATYVVFDVETTGLSSVYDRIIELSAVKMEKGNIIAEFERFINPHQKLSDLIIELTSITDEMLKDAPDEKEVIDEFREFSKGSILVAHNAQFDMGFINTAYKRHGYAESSDPVIDTLELSRYLHPEFRSHRLNTLAKRYDVVLEQHHRAIFDSITTARLAWLFIKEAESEKGITHHHQLNKDLGKGDAYKQARPSHATIYAKNNAGLKDLFKLVSESNVNYFYRVPRIPRTLLNKYRENLLVGSSCNNGEIFEALMQKGYEAAEKHVDFYDFLEIMPKPIFEPLMKREIIKDEATLEAIMKQLLRLGKEHNKLVVATGNVHYLNPEDHIYREILMSSLKSQFIKPGEYPSVHFRTTDEMLELFSFLGEDVAHQLVVENAHQLADQFEEVIPIKDKLYTPTIEGSEEEITQMTYERARQWYGDPLPEIVEERIKKELKSIIGNGFAVIYLISQKLVLKSNEDGYLVGSRGSVGSSFVATLTGITEVNPLAPHYRCPSCQYTEFFTNGEYGSGFDLPEKACPHCQAPLHRDGHDIPFETFLGFYGDKVPDIDLNFSGDYQARAHNYTKVLFGEDKVFRAGTIGTVADKTAYGFVKGYQRDFNLDWRKAEVDRLVQGATGVKRSTGQHPGGIIVIPDNMDVYDFTPIQYPADDVNSEWLTTHFDFHSIHDNVLKLDILGHDDPTMIRTLQDLTGIDPINIPPNDPAVMSLFSSPEALGVTPEQIGSQTGTLGVPEFGTYFVRGMLEQTKPTTFAELLQISGLSHGTDVYLGNAEELIREKGVPLAEVIGCRDDIMVYLMHKGVKDGQAFKIMEGVRKGKGIQEEDQAEMRRNNVPEWYIQSCLKIKYMFPKAHAAAYVLMALRVAYFKVHYPIQYYCAYFSVRASDFDLSSMVKGKDAIKRAIKEIKEKGNEASGKEKNLVVILEIANEMVERGFEFKMVDLDKSQAHDWLIEGNALIAPFRAVPGLGENVANKIIESRQERPFLSKKDLANRGKVSKTIIDYLTEHQVIDHMDDENQISLF